MNMFHFFGTSAHHTLMSDSTFGETNIYIVGVLLNRVKGGYGGGSAAGIMFVMKLLLEKILFVSLVR